MNEWIEEIAEKQRLADERWMLITDNTYKKMNFSCRLQLCHLTAADLWIKIRWGISDLAHAGVKQ